MDEPSVKRRQYGPEMGDTLLIAALFIAATITSQAPAQNRGNAAAPATPQVQIPPGSAGGDNCSLPVGGGFGNVVNGFNLIWGRPDTVCEHLRVFYALQPRNPDVADGVLCQINFVREAAKSKGSDLCLPAAQSHK